VIFGGNFPLLIKLLDAKTNLSVQAHPDDAMADKNHDSFGKTEMWYIMDSDAGAKIVNGSNTKFLEVYIASKKIRLPQKSFIKYFSAFYKMHQPVIALAPALFYACSRIILVLRQYQHILDCSHLDL